MSLYYYTYLFIYLFNFCKSVHFFLFIGLIIDHIYLQWHTINRCTIRTHIYYAYNAAAVMCHFFHVSAKKARGSNSFMGVFSEPRQTHDDLLYVDTRRYKIMYRILRGF